MNSETSRQHEENSENPMASDAANMPQDDVQLTTEQEAEHAVDLLKDQLLRMAADYDNFRKRSRKEVDEARLYGIERIACDLLSVLDNLDRALTHAKDSNDPVIQGVHMVAKQFTEIMATHGVVPFSAVGEKFDPERHEAIAKLPSDVHPENAVIEEVEKGYTVQKRLLRPAKVVVSAGTKEP